MSIIISNICIIGFISSIGNWIRLQAFATSMTKKMYAMGVPTDTPISISIKSLIWAGVFGAVYFAVNYFQF